MRISYIAQPMFKSVHHPIWKAVLSGLLLFLSWPGTGSLTPLIFVAFVPLLLLEKQCFENSKSGLFLYAFIAFLIWNVGATYFIFCVEEPFITSFTAASITYILNALFMAIVFALFHKTKKKIGIKQAFIGLVIFWLSFEYIHYHWDLNWPWLNLGNVFANRVSWIQWYEYTGVQGGSLWIWVVNILLYQIIARKENKFRSIAILAVSAVLLPLIISQIIYFQYEQSGEEVNVVIVQPNIDPYNEKFDKDPNQQLDEMLELAQLQINEETDFVIFPETAIQERGWIDGRSGSPILVGMWMSNFENTYTYNRLKQFVEDNPHIDLVIGASIRKRYGKEKQTHTSRYFNDGDFYYDSFNSAIQFNTQGYEFYHKSKLVPGTEMMPFTKYLAFLENLAWDLGGTSGSLGKQEKREVFTKGKTKIGPLICYESVFGEYVTEYTQQDANLFCNHNQRWLVAGCTRLQTTPLLC